MKRSLAVAAVVTTGLLTACGGGDEDGASAGEASDAAFELRVGTVLPFTGDLSAFGPSLNCAVEIGVDQVNAALQESGSESTVTLVGAEDGQTRAQAGVEAATKLVQSDDAQVLIGEMASNVTLAIAQSVAIPNDVVLITPTSTAPEITDLDDDDLVWRVLASDTFQGQALAQAVFDSLGEGATVNVGARNDAFGAALKRLFVQEFEQLGGTVAVNLEWDPRATNFDTEAQQLVSGDPDAWVVIDFPETYARMGPALARAGGSWAPSEQFMTEAMRNEEALQEIGAQATQGLRGTAPTSEGAPARDALDALFERECSDESLTGFEGSAFDSLVLASLAAVAAGSAEPADLKAELAAVSAPPGTKYTFEQLPQAFQALRSGEEIDYEGAWGPINWTDEGDPGSAIYELWRYRNGRISTLETFTFGD